MSFTIRSLAEPSMFQKEEEEEEQRQTDSQTYSQTDTQADRTGFSFKNEEFFKTSEKKSMGIARSRNLDTHLA